MADSLRAARAAASRANAAFARDDLNLARAEIARAISAWPAQPRYRWNAAILAALARDTARTLQHLKEYADFGVGRDLRADSTFAALWSYAPFTAIERQHERNRSASAHSRTAALLQDSTFWPEGMDVDPRDGTIYVASIRHGVIAAIAADGTTRQILRRDQPGFGAILGVRVDTAHNVLFATVAGLPHAAAHVPSDSAIAALLRIRISDGVIEKRWDLPTVPGGHVLGDVYVAPNGDVYTTDSLQPVLYVLRNGEDALSTVTSAAFANLQGMTATADGRYLFLSDYLVGILRVDRADGSVIRLTDAPHSTSIGCDGIVLDGNRIIAVQNGVQPPRIVAFNIDETRTRITGVDVLDQNAGVAREPTIGAIARGTFYYVADSQWDLHNDDGTPVKGAKLDRPVILALPLRR